MIETTSKVVPKREKNGIKVVGMITQSGELMVRLQK
jgi:hypothetical protein